MVYYRTFYLSILEKERMTQLGMHATCKPGAKCPKSLVASSKPSSHSYIQNCVYTVCIVLFTKNRYLIEKT